MSLAWAGADETFGLPQLTGVLLLSAVVVLLALVAVRISARSGLPTLLLYLGLGLAIGESGLGIHFNDVYLTQVLGYSALILILAEGGLTTRWSGIRDVVAPAAVLSTVGVVVSVAIVGFFAERLLDLPWQVALLDRRGSCLDGRRGGVLGAALGRAAPTAVRDCWRPSPGSTTRRRSS